MLQMPNNPAQFMQQLKSFAQNFQTGRQNPQQIVQQLLNEGKMTQSQFNEYRNIANQMTGMRF